MRRVSDVSDKAGYDAFVERMNQKYGKSWTIWTLTKDEKREFRTYIGNNFDSVKQQKYNGMKRIRDYADYIKCPNSNLLFYGTKLDGNGNDCAVFGTPSGNKFLVQQISMGMGSRGWNSGTKTTMDAETFLTKNPDITIEDLERGAVMFAKDANPYWAKRVHLYKVFDSKNSKDMKQVRDNNNGRKCLYFVDDDTNAELTRKLLNGISHSLKDDPTTVDWVVGEMKKNHCENFVGDWDDEPTTSMMSKDSEDGRYTMYWNDYGEIEIWGNENISDSRKIKDENTPDVLDGVLFIAFTDGTEDDMIAEVNKHANESDTIDGVQYETYETDNSDGVAMIDLCAATDDANAFVKALLKKWGIAENVADLEFEASDEMKEAVNDSRKVNDMTKPAHLRGYAEKVRAKRRNKNADDEPNTDEEKSNVSDSRIRDGFVTRYDVAYNEDPYKLAQRIAKNGTISTRSRHQRPHDVNVNEDTIFHVYNDGDYSYDDFMTKYGVNDSRRMSDGLDYKPFAVFEDDAVVAEFDDEDEAIDFAINYDDEHSHDTIVEVVYCDMTGVCEDIVWSSLWKDERDSYGVL